MLLPKWLHAVSRIRIEDFHYIFILNVYTKIRCISYRLIINIVRAIKQFMQLVVLFKYFFHILWNFLQ